MLRLDNGQVSASAVRGAEGVIGMEPHVDETGAMYKSFIELWSKSASMTACKPTNATHQPHPLDDDEFCDSDGIPTTMSAPTALMVDAVILYAKAMDKIYRSDSQSPDKLHQAALIGNATIPGHSGPITLDSFGDRLGSYEILNLKIQQGRLLRTPQERRLSQVQLTSSSAVFQAVGTYDTTKGLFLDSKVQIKFPGGTTDIPADEEILPTTVTEEFPVEILIIGIGGVVVFFGLLFGCYYYRSRKFIRALRQDLEKLREENEELRQTADCCFVREQEAKYRSEELEAEKQPLESSVNVGISMSQIASYWISKHSKDNCQTAVAVAMAESSGNCGATHQNSDSHSSIDRGLWQINSYWHPECSANCALDCACNAGCAVSVWQSSGWSAWATWKAGAHSKYMNDAAVACGYSEQELNAEKQALQSSVDVGYNPAAAVSWADAHCSSGSSQCAEFASEAILEEIHANSASLLPSTWKARQSALTFCSRHCLMLHPHFWPHAFKSGLPVVRALHTS